MLDVEFYRLHNGVWARDLMPYLRRVLAVIFAIFPKVCRVLLPFFAVIFYCPYQLGPNSAIPEKPHVWYKHGGSGIFPGQLRLILCEKVQFSLPWQEGLVERKFKWHHYIGRHRKPPVWCKLGVSSVCTSQVMADLVRKEAKFHNLIFQRMFNQSSPDFYVHWSLAVAIQSHCWNYPTLSRFGETGDKNLGPISSLT